MKYLTTKEAGEELGIKQNSVVVFIHRGLIKGIKAGRDWLIDRAEIGRYRNERGRPGWRKRDI